MVYNGHCIYDDVLVDDDIVLMTMSGNWFVVGFCFGSVDLKGGRDGCSNFHSTL